MNRIFFMYNNLVDSATLTESSEASGFPAENVQHLFRTKVWRTSGGGTENLVIDHGSAKAVNCVALTNYNWTSAPTTLNLEFSTDNTWTPPDGGSESLTWAAATTANYNKATIVKTFTSKTYRYNRLNVVHGSDFDLGRMFLGEHFTPSLPFASKITQNMIDPSRTLSTIGGQDHTDEIEMYRVVNFSTVARTQAQWELFQKMINDMGWHKDLFIAFDYDNEPDEMTIYGKFTKLPGMKLPVVKVFEMKFSFKESR